ncbi:hypothetical protein M9H77_28581 [Catharanthus roseus]|uniref:Uncharacterized protein n=1 Tax=Catharanthus roseus TaxID=4058 RepID=A0ACC0AFR3_CATRO|nr:hypothetical protein M9H77_28581 [Catharanthus roseus]
MASRVSKIQRRKALHRKLQILKNLTNSKSAKKSCIIKDAFLYICNLKLQLEAITRQHHYLINNSQEVKVEKVGEKYLVIRVSCCKKKRQDLLVSILDAIEKLNLNVIQVRVEANYLFGLEAIVDANINGTDDQVVDVKDVNEAILNAINKCN